jgi:thymidylate synthase (FAD)
MEKMIIDKAKVILYQAPARATLYDTIEKAGRVCYKSEDKITDGSAEKFIRNIIKRGHEAVLEHGTIMIKFVCDRGVSHEIVRHRLATYCQESTRYCNYSQEKFGTQITVIEPCYLIPGTTPYTHWKNAMQYAESSYFALLEDGCSPQEARAVLPNSLKTEVVMTANVREWRHFFRLRCAPAAHPQMREVAKEAYALCNGLYPALFGDLEVNND